MANPTLPALPTNSMQRGKLDREAAEAARTALEASMQYMREHLHSDKFRTEPYINVTDVLLWIDQAKAAAEHAANEVYVYARLRPLRLALAQREVYHYTIVATLPTTDGSQYRTDRFACERANVDQVLDLLRHDGYKYAELEEFEHGSWRYVRRVRL